MSESDIPLPEAEGAVGAAVGALPIESRHDEDDRLRPEFVREVTDKASGV